LDNIHGILTALSPEECLCDDYPLIETYYNNTIVLVPDFVYPVEALGTSGCTREKMFEKLVTSGAIGILALSFDSTPSSGEFLRGYGSHPSDIYDTILFKVITYVDAEANILDSFLNNPTNFMMVSMECESDKLPFTSGLLVISWFGFITGIGNLILAGIALLNVYERRKRRSLGGQREILCFMGLLELVLGLTRVFGCTNSFSHAFVLGDSVVSYSAKAFFSSGLAGLDFFTTLMLALFWLEMAQASKQSRKMTTIFKKHRIPLVLGFLIAFTPDLGMSISAAMYNEGIGVDKRMWIYAGLSLTVSLLFLFSFRFLVGFLNTHHKAMTTLREGDGSSGSSTSLKKLIFHMKKWLAVFCAASILQFLILVVLFAPPAYLISKSQGRMVVVFWGGIYLSGFVQMLSKIIAMRGPPRSIRKSKVPSKLYAESEATVRAIPFDAVSMVEHTHITVV